ncbi:MAG TPA: response regulator transcription factor [Pyrinomonadaceae bacterium]|nr:response regulator transcription factor [Pyrinomonadaceae bacterium]
MEKLRIILAEDHQTVREGIKLLINSQPDMEVIAEADNGEIAVKITRQLLPDILVMDISMPELNGLKAAKKLKQVCPGVKIITLTRHTDDAYLQQLIKAGALGYVLKQSAPTELIRAIRAVAEGKSYLDPTITNKVMGNYARRSALRGENKSELTDRESEVLRMIALGYSNKEIGARMDISVKTVEAHKANAMKKKDMRSRIDIVRYAILQGWMEEN